MVTLLAAQNIDGLQVTVTGLSVVFLVLGLLWLVLTLLNVAFREPQTQSAQPQPKQREQPEPESTEVAGPTSEPIPHTPMAPGIDPRLPAVITAAVVATVGYVPESISIGHMQSGQRPQVVAAIMAAITSHIDSDDFPRSVRIQKVERR